MPNQSAGASFARPDGRTALQTTPIRGERLEFRRQAGIRTRPPRGFAAISGIAPGWLARHFDRLGYRLETNMEIGRLEYAYQPGIRPVPIGESRIVPI
jgi:hypothetical protein